MLITLPKVLGAEQLRAFREKLDSGDAWVDGRATAGYQGAPVKRNEQLAEQSPLARELGATILSVLERHPLFISATLANRVYPPLFNRYSQGMYFGGHIDGAVRLVPGTGTKIRTDISATLFLTAPEDYDGGELVIEDTYGSHSVKLPAGDLLLYPASSLHSVTPISRGTRLASFFWIESMVADDGRRRTLFELDTAIQQLNRSAAEASLRNDAATHVALVQLTGVYHNLLRLWATT